MRAAEEAVRAAEAKKARQVEKKALQKERSRLRTLLLGNVDSPPVIDTEYEVVERLCGRMGLEALRGLTSALGQGPQGAEDALQVPFFPLFLPWHPTLCVSMNSNSGDVLKVES